MSSPEPAPFSSLAYWRNRYAKGQNSGSGSYGLVAEFKAKALNAFIHDNSISRCIEFGSGDGNQLGLMNIPTYLGLDVAPDAVKLCINKYQNDASKSFALYDPKYFVNNAFIQADLTLSMDVILHLIEDEIYEDYMSVLFGASTKHVAIFTTATDNQPAKMAPHNKFRDHRPWVRAFAPNFREVSSVLIPHELGYPEGTGFYFYSN